MTDTRREVGRAATLIGAITIGARLIGFGRILVFTWAVGYSTLGSAYQSANAIPNLVFELVAGERWPRWPCRCWPRHWPATTPSRSTGPLRPC
ncbi:hypothetical protein GCM10029992_51810 [Glycomyces albus]